MGQKQKPAKGARMDGFQHPQTRHSVPTLRKGGRDQTSADPACSPQNLFPAAATILQKRFFFSTK